MTRARREVSTAAEALGNTSQSVLTAVDKVFHMAGELRKAVSQFLIAMRAGDGERQRFEDAGAVHLLPAVPASMP